MSPLELFSDELENLIARSAPGVVALEHRRGHGTGLIFTPDGHLLTKSSALLTERLEAWLPAALGL